MNSLGVRKVSLAVASVAMALCLLAVTATASEAGSRHKAHAKNRHDAPTSSRHKAPANSRRRSQGNSRHKAHAKHRHNAPARSRHKSRVNSRRKPHAKRRHNAPASSRYEVHVAKWGKDWWPGTRALPFATIARAQQVVRTRTATMRRDIVVRIHRGTYALDAPLQLSAAAGDSGENGHRVIYQAARYGKAHPADVTISGGRTIGGWRRAGGGVWKASVGTLQTRQLYVNGARAERAKLGSGLPGRLTTTDTGYVVDSTIPQSWTNPQDIELSYRFKRVSPEDQALFFTEPRCGVASISGNRRSSTITMDQPCFRRARAYYRIEFFGMLSELIDPTEVENSRSFLTQPGTFYLDRSNRRQHVVYYIPRAGERMNSAHVVAPVLEKLVTGGGTAEEPLENVSFRGIDFAHATWLGPDSPGGFIQFFHTGYENGDPPGEPFIMGDATHMPGNVSFRHTEGLELEGNTFKHLGAVALEFSTGSSENIIRGNEIADVSGEGITMGEMQADSEELPEGVNNGNVIDNNWIHAIGVEYHGSGGMFLYKTQDTQISHNQINDIAYSGITTAGAFLVPDLNTRGARITDNLVFDTLNETSDGGGIYLSGPQGTSRETGAVVSGNVVVDQDRDPNIGIYTDQGTNWATVSDNVVYGTQYVFGGCSYTEDSLQNIVLDGNYSDHEESIWACASSESPDVLNHTVLGTTDPAGACQANAGCAAIVANAGLQPSWRHLLD